MATYEDYVKPPKYKDGDDVVDDPLISKLRVRIQHDLNQINGVYDIRIKEAEEMKQQDLKKVEIDYGEIMSNINKERVKDIGIYNDRAECHIDNLITTMHNSPQKRGYNWLYRLFNY